MIKNIKSTQKSLDTANALVLVMSLVGIKELRKKCGLQSLNLLQTIIDQVNSEEDLLNILETNENEN